MNGTDNAQFRTPEATMTWQHIQDIPGREGAVVYIGHEIVITVTRPENASEGWQILVEGDTDTDAGVIPVTIQTVNDDETVTWQV